VVRENNHLELDVALDVVMDVVVDVVMDLVAWLASAAMLVASPEQIEHSIPVYSSAHNVSVTPI